MWDIEVVVKMVIMMMKQWLLERWRRRKYYNAQNCLFKPVTLISKPEFISVCNHTLLNSEYLIYSEVWDVMATFWHVTPCIRLDCITSDSSADCTVHTEAADCRDIYEYAVHVRNEGSYIFNLTIKLLVITSLYRSA